MQPLLSSINFVFIILSVAAMLSKAWKISLSEGLFNAVPCLGLIIFLSFLFNLSPWMVAWIVILGSYLYCVCYLQIDDYLTLACYLLLASIIFCFDIGLRFRSIDDYAYWGNISRYLFTFHALPHDAAYIGKPYLTYMPGLAAFHYLLYTLSHQYSTFFGYFAQGLVALSALMVFFDEKKPVASICVMSCVFILASFAFGTVLARMEADAYVALYFLSISWLIILKGPKAAPLVFLPLLFLSIMKEVGFFFALAIIAMLWFYPVQNKDHQYKKIVWSILGTLILMRYFWYIHITYYHFRSFIHQINLYTVMQSFEIFNPYYQHAQWLYLKSIFLLRFDNILRLPYVCIYCIAAYCMVCILKFKNKPDKTLLIIWSVVGVIYLLMLYVLQAVIFDAGCAYTSLLGFERYYNMFFFPFFTSCLLMIWIKPKPPIFQRLRIHTTYTMVGLVALFLIFGKIRHVHRYYQSSTASLLHQIIINKSKSLSHKNWSVCLSPIKEPAYLSVLPLIYTFMPHRVFYPVDQRDMQKCDIKINNYAAINKRSPPLTVASVSESILFPKHHRHGRQCKGLVQVHLTKTINTWII